MPLPPDRDHRISLDEAAALTRAHRDAASGEPRGGFFHAKQVHDLLAQAGCQGLRYYHARTKNGEPTVVLVAVDGDGNDLTELVLEWSFPCPPLCDMTSRLQG